MQSMAIEIPYNVHFSQSPLQHDDGETYWYSYAYDRDWQYVYVPGFSPFDGSRGAWSRCAGE